MLDYIYIIYAYLISYDAKFYVRIAKLFHMLPLSERDKTVDIAVYG